LACFPNEDFAQFELRPVVLAGICARASGQLGLKIRDFDPRTVIGKQVNPAPTHLSGDIRPIEREVHSCAQVLPAPLARCLDAFALVMK